MRAPQLTSRVARLVLILLAVGALAGAAQDAVRQTSDLPAARDVIRRFVTAIGGGDAVRKYKSRRAIGRFEVPSQGLAGDLEVLAMPPDRQVVRISLAGLGDIRNGFDGKVAWLINPMTGPMLLEGQARDHARMDADFYSELHDESRFKTMETVARTEFEGTPAYKLRLVRASGEDDIEFFSVDTGLLIGSIISRQSPMGPMEATSSYSDYKDFGGVLAAARMRQKVMGVEQVIVITRVEYDTLDEGVFALPPQIKALVK